MRNDNLIKHEILKHLKLKDEKYKFSENCISVKELSEKIKCSYEKAKLNCIELQKEEYISRGGCKKEDSYMYSSYEANVVFYTKKYRKKHWNNIKENTKTWINILATLISVTIAFVSVMINYYDSESDDELRTKVESLEIKEQKLSEQLKKLKDELILNTKNLENLKLEKSKLNQKSEFSKKK